MSSSIWTRCEGERRLAALEAEPWRVVEAQHRSATMALVDSDVEQDVLERAIERVKPPARPARLHWLLHTPFRYRARAGVGSRFARPGMPGLWYGAIELPTALAEKAFHTMLFLDGYAPLDRSVRVELTAFTAAVATDRGLDLTAPPFDAFADRISSPASYRDSHALGDAMRQADVDAFCFRSARDPVGRTNVGVFDPGAFAGPAPMRQQTWSADCSPCRVVFRRRWEPDAFTFSRESFCVDGRLAAPSA